MNEAGIGGIYIRSVACRGAQKKYVMQMHDVYLAAYENPFSNTFWGVKLSDRGLHEL